MGGTKNCPETPRQKMIGMMYLVLTAMLALNVSNEVLNGFTMTNNSLNSTIVSSQQRTESLYGDFEALNAQNPTKTGPWLEKAKFVKGQADALFNTLQEFKVEIVKIADGKKADTVTLNIDNRENLDAAGQYAQIGTDNPKARGKLLREQINAYRIMLDSMNPSKAESYDEIFNTKKIKSLHSGNVVDWETAMFDFMPAVAVTTLLTKYQSDVRATEADVVNYLKGQTDASDFRVNQIVAYALPVSSSYVMQGGKYTAQIVLSAVDSTLKPRYFVNGALINERGIYETAGSRIGENQFSGYIELTRNGTPYQYPFKQSYTVGAPSATVSNADLNVVYRGIDNRFDIAVPGVSADKVSVTVEGGSAAKTGEGKYNIRANRDGEITIVVSANIEGKQMTMGKSNFRVKYLPDPKSFLQYTDGGGVVRQTQDATLTKKLLKTGVMVASYGPDELVKANFRVTEFRMVVPGTSVLVSGADFNSRCLSEIEKLEGGDNVTFKNIKAVGPDGKVRDLPPVSISI